MIIIVSPKVINEANFLNKIFFFSSSELSPDKNYLKKSLALSMWHVREFLWRMRKKISSITIIQNPQIPYPRTDERRRIFYIVKRKVEKVDNFRTTLSFIDPWWSYFYEFIERKAYGSFHVLSSPMQCRAQGIWT